MTCLSTREQLDGFVDDLERSIEVHVDGSFDCDNILLCGVGGSAVSSDFVVDCCLPESRIPVILVKFPDLPSWVGPRTLVVISSYSGNTAETVEMYYQARSRGCRIVAVTSGGILRDLVERDGGVPVLLPQGMHPRHAVGYMIGYTFAVVHAAGGPDFSDRVRAILPGLRRFRDEYAKAKGSLAHELAGLLIDHVPVVCADVSMQSVAFRWKTQVNENSKFVAFCERSPDIAVNGPRSWEAGPCGSYIPIMLIGSEGSERMEAVVSAMEGSGVPVRAIRLGGTCPLDDMFRAVVLGDYISMYMADLRGIDPAEVPPVMQMKVLLGTAMGDRHRSETYL